MIGKKKFGFVSLTCPKSSDLENLQSIGIVIDENTFLETVSDQNTIDIIAGKLNQWLLSFNETIYLCSTRQKEIEVIKKLLENKESKDKVKIKVYLKMIFEDMYADLKKKGYSLIDISFLYDLSQGVFETKCERYEKTISNTSSVSYLTNDLHKASIYYHALLDTIQHLDNLNPDIE